MWNLGFAYPLVIGTFGSFSFHFSYILSARLCQPHPHFFLFYSLRDLGFQHRSSFKSIKKKTILLSFLKHKYTNEGTFEKQWVKVATKVRTYRTSKVNIFVLNYWCDWTGLIIKENFFFFKAQYKLLIYNPGELFGQDSIISSFLGWAEVWRATAWSHMCI